MKTALFITAAVAVLIFAAFGLAMPAHAAQTCAPHKDVVDGLARNYGETVRSMGLRAGGTMVEITASDVNGTWTLIETRPTGVTCIMASGTSFETIAAPPGIDG